ncbi:MAG: TRAP transporter substrate-binding protein [Porticoccaceae bacterium]|jgi:TRAP-type mannitol/chloroaromatic compound transport system substrate-binding protein|nr:MAG: ABC transporter substrate-binding protein [SAR92 bacterium BACL16 MAG-120322-bin99]MDP4654538.1 TRAP transporter substrate-binding protein [Alphaproteobacteria bacterium]MDP4890313.1 TRAP transporter substrate-binding protein [Porticoccaceae bacterium]MDP4987221.1 TRAP transporter substrate-binding protein [Porticoccaceae bacterium]
MRVVSFAFLCVLLVSCADRSTTTGDVEPTAQQSFQWKLVTTWPKNFPGLGTAPENFAKNVERMSNGRLKIKVFGAGQLVPAFEVFDAVSQGTAQIGHGASYYWKGKVPASVFYTAVPFGLNAQEMNAWLQYGGGLELWRELYAPFNLIPFAGGNTGVQMAGWFNREINSIADLKGLKMRIPGLGGEVFTRAGGTSINLPGGELYTSMQTGVIDATEWVGPYNDLAFGFHQVAKYYYYPGWQEPGPTLELIINKAAYESLPADLQAIVEVAAAAANQDMLNEYTARNNAALIELVEKHGVQVKKLPDDVLAEFKRLSAEVVEELASEDPLSRRIAESMKAFAIQAKAYHGISEEAYYNARRQ